MICVPPPAGVVTWKRSVLRRASKNYQVVGDQLHYIDLNVDGSTFKRLVLHGRKEVDQVFMECHLTAGWHRGRDAIIGKIKARYFWPNYYKDIEEKVRVGSDYFNLCWCEVTTHWTQHEKSWQKCITISLQFQNNHCIANYIFMIVVILWTQ